MRVSYLDRISSICPECFYIILVISFIVNKLFIVFQDLIKLSYSTLVSIELKKSSARL